MFQTLLGYTLNQKGLDYAKPAKKDFHLRVVILKTKVHKEIMSKLKNKILSPLLISKHFRIRSPYKN